MNGIRVSNKRNRNMSRNCTIKITWWLIALLIIVWSFIGERWYFDFTQMDEYGCKLYISVKLLFCVAIIFSCYYLKQFRLIELVDRYRDAIHLAMPIIIVYIVMFLLFYPGIWIGDDMYTLECASRLSVPWIQGLMITVWDMFWMMLIPIPAFLVLLQQMMLIGIAIKIFTYVDSSILNSSKRYLVCVPFLLPSTMYYMLFTHRSSTVALLELIVALGIICRSKKNGFSVVESCIMGIAIAIIPGMRTETYIIAIAFIIAYILKYGIHTYKKQVLALITSFLSVCLLIQIGTTSNRDRYSMIYVINPLAYMLQDDNLHGENLAKDLEIISHVINLDQLRSGGGQDYVSNYAWDDNAYVDGYSDEAFVKMKMAYWDLVWQNPDIFLENRVLQFLAANEMAIEDGFPFILRGHHSFENELQKNNADGKFLLFRPFSNTFRSICYIIKIMLDRSVFRWSFNFIIEVVAIIVCALRSIKRREWYGLAINAGFLGLTGALFLLTPEANMMYYLGIYYLGLFYVYSWFLKKYLKVDILGD